ncbi:hypothetical protein [uncultured Amphritea sp.]|uniref:hypothetical protein n=1 Tax=uncultured Amphritea sp. TaxID=981605 RepID=UPI0026373D54|nr:hypothetical protein [uncultured Amphritea sp.]
MNLADPFGRTKARRQKEYESLRASLIKAEISTIAQAEALQADVQRKKRWSIVVAIVATTLLSLLFTEFRIILISLGALFCFWVYKVTGNGKEYIQRYVDEELSESVDNHSVNVPTREHGNEK